MVRSENPRLARSTSPETIGSGLFYHGTTDEVQLGDRVSLRYWFRRRLATVCYIPGISPPHRDMEYEGVQKWAKRLDDGTVLASVYAPDERGCQPPKHTRLISRGTGGALIPDEQLE